MINKNLVFVLVRHSMGECTYQVYI